MSRGGNNKTHGAATPGTPLYLAYRSWLNMMAKWPGFICHRWSSAQAFLDDMGTRQKGLRLCLRDPESDFNPDNCYWGTRDGVER